SEAPGLPVSPSGASSAGQQLQVNVTSAPAWREIEWPTQNISFKVPGDWDQQKLDPQEVEFRPPDRSVYFTARGRYFERKISLERMVEDLRHQAEGKFKRGEIAGFRLKGLGEALGLVEIQRQGEGTTVATWTLYFDTSKFGTESVTF